MIFNGNPIHFKELDTSIMPVKEFINVLKKSIRNDFESSCGNQIFAKNKFNYPMAVIVVVLCCLNGILIICYYILHRHIYNKKRDAEKKRSHFLNQNLISS
jgi:hypothetical protein